MRLERGHVHIVSLELDAPIVEPADCLDDDERARAARFVFDRDRVRFVAAHSLLRRTLSHFLSRAPSELRFAVAERGKPFLVDDSLQFNLSHSADRALVALTGTQPIGVDIEWMNPDIEFRQIAEQMFSPAERAALAAVTESELPAAFYRIWTRKEAFIKARGDGLSLPLDTFDVSAAPDGGLVACRIDRCDRWTLASIDVEAGYAAALAVEGAVERVWRWEVPTLPR